MERTSSSRVVFLLTAAVTLVVMSAPAAFAQSAIFTGRIVSESGQPIENGNAFITEMNISVGTNAQGRYSITIPAERVRGQTVVLRVRAIGHLAQTKEVILRAGTQTNDFELKRDINRLQEVVVTGVTGATEQKKTTFAVTSLNAEQDITVNSGTSYLRPLNIMPPRVVRIGAKFDW